MVIWLCEEPPTQIFPGILYYGIWTDHVNSIPVMADRNNFGGLRGMVFLKSGGNADTIPDRPAYQISHHCEQLKAFPQSTNAHALTTEAIDGFIQEHPDLDYVEMEPDELLALLPDLPRIGERIER